MKVVFFAKQTRNTYPSHAYQPSQPFSIVHSDIWGPSRTLNINGSRWFITFIDDHTRACWVYLLKNKSDCGEVFKKFHKHVENVFQSRIHVLRSDNGGEYFANDLKAYLTEHGILHQSSCTKTPQQNGVAERKNRHLLEMSRAIMINCHVPHSFWGEAVLTAAYLINRLPSKVLDFSTPIQCLQKCFPKLRVLNSLSPRVFGCKAYVYNTSPSRGKLDPKAIKCIFLGY